ncbi:Caudovirales tail fibre assembly protein [Pragia fontium]|uniref:tail fiber assembly protein n=1 Tax=Pragia fontium TaxID=82985 RepID=UPI000DF8AA5A|nr:tail fiber assembly protein [Pragia fontium]SUB81757.1 Caudovirales tail fibre assembly protein [Pragia fontium]SUC81320.1 Caudovirales tail fibre assembly protein [Pragia fontium]
MSYIYSSKDNSFYPSEFREVYESAGTWPSDGVFVDNAIFIQYSIILSGKIRGAGDDGMPCWIDSPLPTTSELIEAAKVEKQRLISKANIALIPLTDAIELDIATDEEKKLYNDLRKYRILLNRVDITLALDIQWPKYPC